MLTIQLNGKPDSVPEGISLKKLLETKGVNPHTVACEVNLKIIRRANLDATEIHQGDEIEIIQMIGGG